MSEDSKLYAFDQCRAYPLTEGRMLVHSPRSNRHSLLTPDVVSTLYECRSFRTLDDHVAHITAVLPGLRGQEANVRQVLDQVRRDGLLISAGAYPEVLRQGGKPASAADPPVIAVITWERPETLKRCLESMDEQCDLARVERIYVVDDSRTGEILERNRQTTQAFAERAPVPVHYLGAEEQDSFVERLVRQLPALEDAIRFLLDRERWTDHWSSGLARSVAQLMGVGRRLVVLDDDILCEVFEPHRRRRTVAFSDRAREADFFADRSEWAPFKAQSETDPIARHARVLGLGLADALHAQGIGEIPEASFSGADVAFAEQLRADAPVLVSQCGSLGDPGTARTNWLTGLEGRSLERLLASEDAVERALNVRNCWCGRSATHVGPRPTMSQMTGLDNRRLLPPYLPILRGEDRLFGDMVEFLFPDSVSIDLPFALPHLPMPERRWSDDDRPYDIGFPFPRFFIQDFVENRELPATREPLRRLGHLAGVVQDLADRDHDRLVRHHMDRRLADLSYKYRHLTRLREQTQDAPAPWHEYLDDALQRLNRELVSDPLAKGLKGHPGNLEDQRLTAWWRDFWKQFANGIRAWPSIRQAARHIAPGSRSS